MKAANETASRITKPARIERVVLFIESNLLFFNGISKLLIWTHGYEKGVATNLSGGFYV